MSTVDVSGAIAALTATCTASQKQVLYATRVALTRSAQRAQAAEQHEIRDVFRSPTPYTQASVYVEPATKARLQATVKLKDDATKATPAAKYLAPQIDGGQRAMKRFERALQLAGVLPTGYLAVPGSGARLDAYGNMSRGQIVQILAFFRAFPEMGYKANMTDKGRARLARGSKRQQGFAYFVGRPGDRLPLGVWQRVQFSSGTALKPVLIFVRSALYQERFDFAYTAENAIADAFPAEFAQAYGEAVGSTR